VKKSRRSFLELIDRNNRLTLSSLLKTYLMPLDRTGGCEEEMERELKKGLKNACKGKNNGLYALKELKSQQAEEKSAHIEKIL
jgi:hypothetical protein